MVQIADERYAVLRIRDFRLSLAVRFFDGLAIQMLSVAVGWQIFQLSHDALRLGFIGLAQGIPYLAVALWVGHLVDLREKRAIIASAEAWSLASAIGLASLTVLNRPPLWAIYFFLAWGGICRSFQWTAMSAYMQLIVPQPLYSKAAGWSTSVWHTATILGPAVGGVIYSLLGPTAAYSAVAACLLIAWLLAFRMGRLPPTTAIREKSPGAQEFLSGIRFVLSQQVVFAAMSLDMVGMLFGGVDGVLPIFASVLGAGAAALGFLRAAPAVGALAAALYMAHHHSFRRMGTVLFTCLTAFGLCIIAFAFSRNFFLSLAILAASGIFDAISMVVRASIYQMLTPDHLRGRVASVNGIFIRSSNQLGAFESGLAAKLMGLVPSVIFGGCMTLATVAIAAWKATNLRTFDSAASAPST